MKCFQRCESAFDVTCLINCFSSLVRASHLFLGTRHHTYQEAESLLIVKLGPDSCGRRSRKYLTEEIYTYIHDASILVKYLADDPLNNFDSSPNSHMGAAAFNQERRTSQGSISINDFDCDPELQVESQRNRRLKEKTQRVCNRLSRTYRAMMALIFP